MKFWVAVTRELLDTWYEKEVGWRVFCCADSIARIVNGEADARDDAMIKDYIFLDKAETYKMEWASHNDSEDVFWMEFDTEEGT